MKMATEKNTLNSQYIFVTHADGSRLSIEIIRICDSLSLSLSLSVCVCVCVCLSVYLSAR